MRQMSKLQKHPLNPNKEKETNFAQNLNKKDAHKLYLTNPDYIHTPK